MEKKKILLFWSGGKDSNFAYTKLKQSNEYHILGLVTTVSRQSNSVKFHGISEALLVDQAKFLGVPLIRIYLDDDTNDQEYCDLIGKHLAPFIKKGLHGIAFGDLHLKEIRNFREYLCKNLNVTPIFPLWEMPYEQLLKEYFELNHQAIITSVDKKLLDNSYLAKIYDREWLSRLPSSIDLLGENGEFHTFATFSPYFKMRVPFSKAIAIDEGPYTVTMLKGP